MNRPASYSALRAAARAALLLACLAVTAAFGSLRAATTPSTGNSPSANKTAPEVCPPPSWVGTLPGFLQPGAPFPSSGTVIGASDCMFHQWSWEAFLWATALDANGVPRFMNLHTPDDLFLPASAPPPAAPRLLSLGMRATHATGAPHVEGAGAIVEADGNMLVAPNGYPVLASVHMNDAYFKAAKKNLIVTGGYKKYGDESQQHPDEDLFPEGAAVFKAMWLRLDAGQQPPKGAFVTHARVPVLTVFLTADNTLYATPSGQTTTINVALIGLHVVGRTVNHPEFVWGTFEHKLNSPRWPDGTNKPKPTDSDPNTYTLYKGGTFYSQTNIPSTQATATSTATPLSAPSTTITTTLTSTPTFTLDPTTQKFSPVSNVVLANATGSETHSPNGPENIANLNTVAQGFLASLPPTSQQPNFANYELNGTVWMAPGTFNLQSNSNNAVGSVNLANSTAETFVQNMAGTTTPSAMQNCFSCHNPTTFQDVLPLPNLQARLIAISHVTATGSLYAVPNLIAVGAPPSASSTTPSGK